MQRVKLDRSITDQISRADNDRSIRAVVVVIAVPIIVTVTVGPLAFRQVKDPEIVRRIAICGEESLCDQKGESRLGILMI